VSIIDQILREQYPHEVPVFVHTGNRLHDCRQLIDKWCRDNIYEYDLAPIWEKRNITGYAIRCTNMDDWMMAKIRWEGIYADDVLKGQS
jgi:hypothetical protein